jgi:hypothetical protein
MEKVHLNSWKHVIIITRSRPQIKTFKWHIFAAIVSITQLTSAAQLFVALGVHINYTKVKLSHFRHANSSVGNNANLLEIMECGPFLQTLSKLANDISFEQRMLQQQ